MDFIHSIYLVGTSSFNKSFKYMHLPPEEIHWNLLQVSTEKNIFNKALQANDASLGILSTFNNVKVGLPR